MKRIIGIMIIAMMMAAVSAKPINNALKQMMEYTLTNIIEKSLEENKEKFEQNSLTIKQMEENFSRLDKKKDKEILIPGLKFLKVSKKYQQWQAELIATLELEREVYSGMIESGEYDNRIRDIDLVSLLQRQRSLEDHVIAAQTKYNVAVKAYNLKRGM